MTDIVDEEKASSSVQQDLALYGEDPAETSLVPAPENSNSRLITARGTEDGLVLRIDGRADWPEIMDALTHFIDERSRFLKGGEVSIEWMDQLPTREQSQELEALLRANYKIEIVGRKRKSSNPRLVSSKASDEADAPSQGGAGDSTEGRSPLFESIERAAWQSAGTGRDVSMTAEPRNPDTLGSLPGDEFGFDQDAAQLKQMTELLGEAALYEEDANARVYYGTLRSGQRVETPFSLIVVGDVNPGADLIAGGDIIVSGALRGTAHASAYDDRSRDNIILALKMQPVQLRIGSVISRGSGEPVFGAEVARIEDRRIIVESYRSRAMGRKRAS